MHERIVRNAMRKLERRGGMPESLVGNKTNTEKAMENVV